MKGIVFGATRQRADRELENIILVRRFKKMFNKSQILRWC